MKFNKYKYESIVLFLLSPFITVLFQMFFLIKGSRFALKIFIFTLGLIGYIYVPSYSNDKTRYYERYEVFKGINFEGFIGHLVITKRPDFFFEALNYIFAILNVNIQLLFLLINTFSIYTVFKLSDLITNYFASNKRLVSFLLILFSFAIQHLYSGIRFTFASCIFLWGVYFFEFKKNKTKGALILLLSLVTHFSMLALVLTFVLFQLFKRFNFKYIFYISFLFLLIPKEALFQLFGVFSLGDGYASKVDSYVHGDDFITQNFDNNFSSVIVYYARNLWIYFAYLYLIIQSKNRSNRFLQLILLYVALVNVFYAFPTVFSRYLILIKFLFTIYLISNYLSNKKKWPLVFLILYFITFCVDLYVIRPNLNATFMNSSNFTLITILNREVGLDQVIDNM